METSIGGLIPAAYTPFDDRGRLRVEIVPILARHYRETGISGVFCAGTTGEFYALTSEERKSLAEAWRKECDAALPLIVHVGHTVQADARDLASHAQSIEADAVAAVAPPYIKPRSIDELIEFLEPIAKAASPLPFFYYDIPALHGLDLPTHQFLEKAGQRIPNLAGVKFTRSDLNVLLMCLESQHNRFTILFGRDEYYLAAIALGSQGAVGSTYNFAARIFNSIGESWTNGNVQRARILQTRAARMIDILLAYHVIPAGKVLLRKIGIDCGPVRAPLSDLTPRQEAEMLQQLVASGFDPEDLI